MGIFKSQIIGKVFRGSRFSVEQADSVPSITDPSAPFSQNSANFSTTVEQLVEYLGEDINIFDLDSVSEADNARLQQLKVAGEQWGKGAILDVQAPGVREWRADAREAQFIQIACHASNAIRPKPSSAPSKPPGTEKFSKIENINSSLSGAVKKGISIYYCGAAGEGLVIVCVRAGGRWGDWVINGGFRMLDVDRDFIDLESPLHTTVACSSRSPQSAQAALQAHAGFITAARASTPAVAEALEKAVGAPVEAGRRSITHVVFAGHSAGGAVASLLFAHFSTCVRRYPFLNPANISLDLVTFGSPPILSWNINRQIKDLLHPSSVFLAIVAEGDPVPKLDMAYMNFLAQAFRQTCLLPPNQAQRQPSSPPPLPPLTIHSLGDIIMFRDTGRGNDGTDIRMYEVQENVLANAAWVNMPAHFMYVYLGIVAAAPGLRVRLT